MSRGVVGRRSTPSQRASAVADRGGRDGPSWSGDKPTQPSARSLRPLHTSPTPSRSGRRPHVAARSASAGDGHRARQHKDKRTRITPEQTPAQSPPTPSEWWRPPTRSGPAKQKGRVPLERQKPAPSEYPHATALGKFRAPRQNPHVLPPGFGSTHPSGGSIGFWLIGYKKRGVRERDEACGTRSQ